MSAPTFVHEDPDQSYTLTCPEDWPFPSLPQAPIATLEPSADRDTDQPYWSFVASPSMSAPNRVVIDDFLYTLFELLLLKAMSSPFEDEFTFTILPSVVIVER